MHHQKPLIPRGINLKNPFHLIAVGFGAGLSPIAPGTMGTLVAIPIYLWLSTFSVPVYTIVLLIAVIISFGICEVADRAISVHDHPSIVLDEILGFLMTMWAVRPSLINILLGFLLFRLFDIWKPFPISWVNDHITGGIGVMVDDLLAGAVALIVLQIILWLA
jgi:phosphatidylglycerophosphatase A